MSSRYEKRKEIITAITQAGLSDLLNFHSWNQPLAYTKYIKTKQPHNLARWKQVLEIMDRYAPGPDIKEALSLYQ